MVHVVVEWPPRYILGTSSLPQYCIFLGPLVSEVVWEDKVRRNPKESTELHFSPNFQHSDKSNNRVEKFHSSLIEKNILFEVVNSKSYISYVHWMAAYDCSIKIFHKERMVLKKSLQPITKNTYKFLSHESNHKYHVSILHPWWFFLL